MKRVEMEVILASKSPRRREILENLGLSFKIIVADADESSNISDPCELVKILAERKGRAVEEKLGEHEDKLIIACDTVVYAEGEILGKPKSRDEAKRMIKMLSGRSHKVISGLYLSLGDKKYSGYEESTVTFGEMDDNEIEGYICGSEPYDKAGGYAIQGKAAVYIKGLCGDYFNVVGLPVAHMYRALKEFFEIKLFNI